MKNTDFLSRRQSWPAPTHNLLGTMRQAYDAIDLYLTDPTRRYDPVGAWSLAWHVAVVLPMEAPST